MNTREQRRFLVSELVQVEDFIQRVEGHPLMEPQYKQRANAIRKQLASLPEVGPEARTILFFRGKPVKGTTAIDAQFAANVLTPFLEMVKSQYAAAKHGKIGERGPRKDEDEARLLLTGTPGGSFGLELSAPHSDDLFADERLATVLVQVTRMIESAAESDEGFLLNLDDITERSFARLPEFFKVLKEENAELRMQTGDIEFELDQKRVTSAYERIQTSHTAIAEIEVEGRFRGATLDTWRFDFRTTEGEPLNGRLSSELSEDAVSKMLIKANQPAVARIKVTTTVTRTAAMRRRYELIELLEPTVT